MQTANALFETYLPQIEQAFDEYLPVTPNDPRAQLADAMRYAVVGGGKRIRPVLMMEFCRVCGGEPKSVLPFACALEMIHSYSLIHDDLPCMDNDDIRRGKPSTHRAFGEATALLAGDGLLTHAFETMLTAPLKAESTVRAAACLARAAGFHGMVGGQAIDLDSENKKIPLELLQKLDDGKTVALIRAACEMGCIVAEHEEFCAAACAYARGIGMAFQICDDLLDVESTTEVLGKPVGSDAEKQKSTYVSLLGIDGARKAAADYTEQAVKALDVFGERGDALKELAWQLFHRSK